MGCAADSATVEMKCEYRQDLRHGSHGNSLKRALTLLAALLLASLAALHAADT